MHRRARHLNARHAGAGLVLDARRLTGLNDGDAVSTWNDVSGNGRDATQSTSGKKPTYNTNSVGGSSSLSFDGGDGLATSAFNSSPAHVSISVFSLSAGSGFVWEQGTGYLNNGDTWLLANNIYNIYARGSGEFPTQTSGKNVSGQSLSWAAAGVWNVVRSSCEGTVADHVAFKNGSQMNLVTGSANQNPGTSTYSLTLNVGARNNASSAFITGKISYIARLFTNPSNSLRKRLEHSAAFSFKIQCS